MPQRPSLRPLSFACAALLATLAAHAQSTPAATAPATTAATAVQRDSSYIAPDGTAHVARIVPVPQSLSAEAQELLKRPDTDAAIDMPLPDRRALASSYNLVLGRDWQLRCPVTLTSGTLGGVPVRNVTPQTLPAANKDKVLLNLHGGGFDSDSGSYTETVPIAFYAQIPVVAALYRLAPEHPFPAAVDDAVAVYKELLKTHKPTQIAIYGTSAGAILTAQVAVRLRQLGLPEPAALGIFSGLGDFARNSDSFALYGLHGFSGYHPTPGGPRQPSPYVGTTDPKDPVLSPIYADLKNMPPALFVSSGRDMLLSGTIDLERAFLRAGNDPRLIVFEGLPHAFWYNPHLPESIEASQDMAAFLAKQLQ